MRFFPLVLMLIVSALVLGSTGCSNNDGEKSGDDDTGPAQCGLDEFTQKLNACNGLNRTPDEVMQDYQDLCTQPDEMVTCACEAFRDYGCQAAQGKLAECSAQYCYPQ